MGATIISCSLFLCFYGYCFKLLFCLLREFSFIFFCLECVKRKYPRAPETAFAFAREAANQYGLDQKGKHGVDFVTEMLRQPENTHHQDEENQDEDS